MRTPRLLLALFLIVFSTAPVFSPASSSPENLSLASDTPSRNDQPDRASRSDDVSLAPVEDAPTDTTTSTTTSTTVAPTTTTTAAPVVKKAAVKRTTTTTEQPKAPTATGSGKQAVVEIARAQVGKAYRSGGTGPNAFDCSGLVFYVFNEAGIKMPRLTSGDFLGRYTKVSRAELEPGDLIVSPGHVGIYVGDGKQVHASTPRGGVKLSPMDSAGKASGYARV